LAREHGGSMSPGQPGPLPSRWTRPCRPA